jgi:uncharacterized membrane protein
MKENIVSGLVVALIVGIAGLAYRHSNAYKKSYAFWLMGAVFIIFFAVVFWTFGVNFVYERLKDYVDASKAKQPLETIEFYKISFLNLFLFFIVSNGYLFGLRYVDNLIEHSRKLEAEEAAKKGKL